MLKLSLLTRVYGRTAGNSMNGDTIKHRTREEVLGVERTVVVTYEQKLYHRNLKTFIKGIEKSEKLLKQLKEVDAAFG